MHEVEIGVALANDMCRKMQLSTYSCAGDGNDVVNKIRIKMGGEASLPIDVPGSTMIRNEYRVLESAPDDTFLLFV
jgi:hypothetical protein